MQTIAFWSKIVIDPSFFFFHFSFFNTKNSISPVKNKVKIRFFAAGWQWHASCRCNFIFTALWVGLKYFYPTTSNLQNYMKIEYKLQANLHGIKPTKNNNLTCYFVLIFVEIGKYIGLLSLHEWETVPHVSTYKTLFVAQLLDEKSSNNTL